MKHLLVIVIALMLGGCGKGLTRLMPKVEKISLPEELMKPPQDLKIIVKPDPPPINDDKNASNPQAEIARDVITPK
jgi:hypothetical protein